MFQIKSRSQRKKKKCLESKLAQLSEVSCFKCTDNIDDLYDSCLKYSQLQQEFCDKIINAPRVRKQLHVGRLVAINSTDFPNHLAVITRCLQDSYNALVLHQKDKDKAARIEGDGELWTTSFRTIQLVLEFTSSTGCFMPAAREERTFTPISIRIQDISRVYQQKVDFNESEILRSIQRFKFSPENFDSNIIDVVTNNMYDAYAKLAEINYYATSLEQMDIIDALASERGKILTNESASCQRFQEHLQSTCQRLSVRDELKQLEFDLSYSALRYMPEFEKRIRVLRRLNYLDESNLLQLKG